jgi:iron complex outermembrane receptor protein
MGKTAIPRGAARTAIALASSVYIFTVGASRVDAAPDQAPQQSEPRLAELSLEQLGQIEITSVSKQPDEVRRTAVAIHVITADDIRRSGAVSLPEALRLAPGVEVARIDSDHWSIGVRGFADGFSKSLLVLIDGRSLYTPLFAGIYWPANDTLIEDIERIEVIRGPGGTIWGGNAVTGVINVITKRASETRGAFASIGGGSVNHGTAAVRYGGGNSTGFDYRLYAKGFSIGPQFHQDAANYDEFWMGQTGFKAEWAATSRNRVTLQGDLSTGSHGQKVSIASLEPAANAAVAGPLEATGGNVLARWERTLGSGDDLNLQAYYDHTSWQAPHFGETRSTVDLDFVHGLGLPARQRLVWGLGARWSPSEFSQTVPSLDFDPRHENATLFSAFVQDEIQIVPNTLTVTGGTKIERNNYTGVEIQPSARVLWTPNPKQTVWAAVTRAVRPPSRIERSIRLSSFATTLSGVPIFIEVDGNASFDSERLVGYEGGYRTLIVPDTYVDFAIFHHQHDGLATLANGGTAVEVSPLRGILKLPYVNGVDGSANGFEIAPDWRRFTHWQVKGSYSYLHLDLHSLPINADVNAIPRYENSSPHHQARIQSRFTLPRGVAVDATYRYVSALPARQVDAYHTADLRAEWPITRSTWFSILGQNLLSPYHVEFDHAPPPSVGVRRSVYAAMTWTLTRAARP